jgi:hypothetical protein
MALTVKEAIERLKYLRLVEKNITDNQIVVNDISAELTNEAIPLFEKTIHLVISYNTGTNALTAVDAIKARVQGGDTSGDVVNENYAYDFYLE